jgi:hypothetical protein
LKVTHIAPPTEEGMITGLPPTQEGVVEVPYDGLGVCAGVLKVDYATTTEVYPDSPLADDDQCNRAQVAAVVGALTHVVQKDLGKKEL